MLCHFAEKDAHLLERLFGIKEDFKLKRIMVAGGGKIGFKLPGDLRLIIKTSTSV